MPNFVKFQRGSAAAYAALQTKDLDTLYFIYDANDASAGGLLYLGNTLIGGTGSLVGSTTLAGLTDVDLTELADGALLQYDIAAQQWIAVAPSDINAAGISVNIGTLGGNETVAEAQTRIGGNSPNEGDIVIVSGEPYVYDGSSWQSLTSTSLNSRVSALETSVTTLSSGVSTLQSDVSTLQTQMNAVDGKIASAISSANHLSYEVVGTLNDIDTAITSGTATNKIFLVPNNSSTGNLYDEYMVINNNKELVGNFGTDLSGYVTTATFNALETRVATLESNANNYVTTATFNTTISSLEDRIDDVEGDITTIYQMLEWNPISN